MNLSKLILKICTMLVVAGHAYANCSYPDNAAIQALASEGAVFSEKIQTDFGRRQHSSACYLEAWPSNTEKVSRLVFIAYQHNIPIRTQGASHSQNGNSLPKNFDLLIHTTNLNQATFYRIGQVHAGAGIPIDLLSQTIEKNTGYFLPISNEGGVAPTIGGFISAGGTGKFSYIYGGFWEHVNSLTLVTADGNVTRIKKTDPDFKYVFGSMGQLGIITEVELNLLRSVDKTFSYPLNRSITIKYDDRDGNKWPSLNIKPGYWFTLFIPPNRFDEARADLAILSGQYPHALDYNPMFLYSVAVISLVPPLIYDKKERFLEIGLWGTLNPSPEGQQEFLGLVNSFYSLVFRKHYQQYIQTGPLASPSLYGQYFSKQTLSEFKTIKKKFDPKFLFNKNSFFTD